MYDIVMIEIVCIDNFYNVKVEDKLLNHSFYKFKTRLIFMTLSKSMSYGMKVNC